MELVLKDAQSALTVSKLPSVVISTKRWFTRLLLLMQPVRVRALVLRRLVLKSLAPVKTVAPERYRPCAFWFYQEPDLAFRWRDLRCSSAGPQSKS